MDKWRLEKLESEINDVDCLDKIRPFIDENADLVVKLLLEKLAEKDKEIGKLLAVHLEKCFVDFKREHDQQLRHEICEKIRKEAYKQTKELIYDDKSELLNEFVIREKDLDQIEKGEKDW